MLGWGWSLLNPLATLAVYAIIFGFFLKFTPPVAGNGTLQNFAIYLFTGLVIWNFFYAIVTGACPLLGVGPLIKKIYFPPWTPVLGATLATMAQLGVEMGLLAVDLHRRRQHLLDRPAGPVPGGAGRRVRRSGSG